MRAPKVRGFREHQRHGLKPLPLFPDGPTSRTPGSRAGTLVTVSALFRCGQRSPDRNLGLTQASQERFLGTGSPTTHAPPTAFLQSMVKGELLFRHDACWRAPIASQLDPLKIPLLACSRRPSPLFSHSSSQAKWLTRHSRCIPCSVVCQNTTTKRAVLEAPSQKTSTTLRRLLFEGERAWVGTVFSST